MRLPRSSRKEACAFPPERWPAARPGPSGDVRGGDVPAGTPGTGGRGVGRFRQRVAGRRRRTLPHGTQPAPSVAPNGRPVSGCAPCAVARRGTRRAVRRRKHDLYGRHGVPRVLDRRSGGRDRTGRGQESDNDTEDATLGGRMSSDIKWVIGNRRGPGRASGRPAVRADPGAENRPEHPYRQPGNEPEHPNRRSERELERSNGPPGKQVGRARRTTPERRDRGREAGPEDWSRSERVVLPGDDEPGE